MPDKHLVRLQYKLVNQTGGTFFGAPPFYFFIQYLSFYLSFKKRPRVCTSTQQRRHPASSSSRVKLHNAPAIVSSARLDGWVDTKGERINFSFSFFYARTIIIAVGSTSQAMANLKSLTKTTFSSHFHRFTVVSGDRMFGHLQAIFSVEQLNLVLQTM